MIDEADRSNGYEAIAEKFIKVRSETGTHIVQQWASMLPPGSSVLDIGAGSGVPLTAILVNLDLQVSAIDASPTMTRAFAQRFPDIEIACEPAESSRFFDRTFNAVMAVGLLFLLSEDTQIRLISRVARALNPDGEFLFSAPEQACQWTDILTGRASISLGSDVYRTSLAENGLFVLGTYKDAGGSNYFRARKR